MPEGLYLETMADFEAAIAATKGGIPMIVDFTASWCPPCKRIGPIFEGMAPQYAGRMHFKKVDVDANADAKNFAEIAAMPTFRIYKDGVQIEDHLRGADE